MDMNRLLDRYPLLESELEHLSDVWCQWYPPPLKSSENTGPDPFPPSFSTLAQSSSVSTAMLGNDNNNYYCGDGDGDGDFCVPAPLLRRLQYCVQQRVVVVTSTCATANPMLYAFEHFLEAVCCVLGRRGSVGSTSELHLVHAIFDVCASRKEEENEEEDIATATIVVVNDADADADAVDDSMTLASCRKLMTFWFRIVNHAADKMALRSSNLPLPSGWIRALSKKNTIAAATSTSPTSASTITGSFIDRDSWIRWMETETHLMPYLHQAFEDAIGFPPPVSSSAIIVESASEKNDECSGNYLSISKVVLHVPSPQWFTRPEAVALMAMGISSGLNHSTDSDNDNDRLLFDSDADGLAFLLMQQALIGFYGPTLLVIRTTHNDCLGYYTTLPWRVAPNWYSTTDERVRLRAKKKSQPYPDVVHEEEEENSSQLPTSSSFLFQLSPSWNCYRLIDHDDNNEMTTMRKRGTTIKFHQYLNALCDGRITTRSSYPTIRGLAVGGVAPDKPRFWLTPELEHCWAMAIDQTFEMGPLLGGGIEGGGDNNHHCNDEESIRCFFDVDRIQVWGMIPHHHYQSGHQAYYDRACSIGQQVLQSHDKDRIRKARIVDKRAFVEDVALLSTHR